MFINKATKLKLRNFKMFKALLKKIGSPAYRLFFPVFYARDVPNVNESSRPKAYTLSPKWYSIPPDRMYLYL